MGRLKPNDNKPAVGAGAGAATTNQVYDHDQKPPPHQPFPPPQEPIVQSPHHYNLQQHPNNNVINYNNNNNNVGFGMHQQQQPAGFGQPVVGVVAMSTSPSPFVNNNNVNIPNQQNQPWKTGLFGCMDDPKNAITTLVCPCVTFGQVAEILDSGRTSCGSGGMLYWKITLLAVPCLISCTYRTKLRSRFGLIESPLPDCLVHCLCEHCALCQMHRELRQRGLDPSIGWAGNVAKQQQQQQQFGMTPPMQQKM